MAAIIKKLFPKLLIFALFAGGCVAASHMGTGGKPRDFDYTKPPETNDGWHTARVSDVGLDSYKIDKLLSYIHNGDLKNIYAVVVVKNGLLVVDEYFNGANRTHIGLIASTTKSIVSLLLGIALEDSTSNKSVKTTLRDFFPTYSNSFHNDEKGAITLYHALTMTAGMDWDENTFPHPHERNPNTQMYTVADPVGFILDRDVHSPAGKRWNYNSGLSVLLGEVVRNLSGEYIDVFAETRLFNPLQFARYQWGRHAEGTIWSNGDLYIRPRDLAKVGQLVLNKGKWQGQQIVSKDWIIESTSPQTPARHGFNYGYQWWLGTARYAERRLDVIFGSGTGGQKLFIIPEVDMVVVVMSKVFGNKGGQARATWVLTDYVLPAALPKIKHKFYTVDKMFANAAVGKYYNASDDQMVRIGKSGSTLYAKPTFFSRFELKPLNRKSFYGHWGPIGDVYVDFAEDEKGDAVAADVHYLLGTRNFRKTH
jgi:CubicO group peptidase (beta-lactamase class C family)